MQRSTHAAIGATTLGLAWSPKRPAQVDAVQSISLVGSRSTTAAPADPIQAARRWLADPVRSASMGPELRVRADQALDVAERHLQRLHALVADLASDLDFASLPDPARVALMDELATELREFSDALRNLLDPEDRPDDALDRLARGLEAATAGGGLRALTAAM